MKRSEAADVYMATKNRTATNIKWKVSFKLIYHYHQRFEVTGYLASCELEEVSEIIEELCNRFAAKTKSLKIRTATLHMNMNMY